MTTETTSSTYENGKRVEVQRVTYEKSDDLYALASVQRRYENLCKQIDNAAEDTDLESLHAEKAKLGAEIEERENIVSGYEATE